MHKSWALFKTKINRTDGHVIQSLLDTDFYKLTMLQVFWQKFPNATSQYLFKCRNDIDLSKFALEIHNEIEHLCSLRFTKEELNWLRTIRFFQPGFIDYLEVFKLKRRNILVRVLNGKLDIRTTPSSSLIQSSMFEIYILRIVHEIYSRNVNLNIDLTLGREKLQHKIKLIKDYSMLFEKPLIADFGGRRCFTGAWHEEVVKTLADSNVITGTSNVMLAMNYKLKPIGTFAHEFVQTFQGIGVCPIADSQKVAFQTWADVYRGDLGIALSDTLGNDKFLEDFDLYFAKLFDGLRHDSGDPLLWGEKMIVHFKRMKIDPKTKVLVFSDGLDIPKVLELHKHFRGRIKVSFGVGTNLTNDVGVPALQNVMKQIYCNGRPTAKISNNPAKTMCIDKSYLEYLKRVIL